MRSWGSGRLRLPVPGQQLGQVGRGAGRDPAQDIPQPRGRIEIIAAGCDQQAVDHCTAPSGVRMPNEEPVLFPMQVGRIAFSTRFVAISGTGSWDRLLGAFDGVFRDRSASVAVISSECPVSRGDSERSRSPRKTQATSHRKPISGLIPRDRTGLPYLIIPRDRLTVSKRLSRGVRPISERRRKRACFA